LTLTQNAVTVSSSWKCKNLGNIVTPQGTVPVTMAYLKEPDGCKVFKENVKVFANNPDCIVPCSEEDAPGCVELPQGQGQKAYRKYCMGLGLNNCNECMENSSGSPQEYWYWNNGQLVYSCFDLTAFPTYACPGECYARAGCP